MDGWLETAWPYLGDDTGSQTAACQHTGGWTGPYCARLEVGVLMAAVATAAEIGAAFVQGHCESLPWSLRHPTPFSTFNGVCQAIGCGVHQAHSQPVSCML